MAINRVIQTVHQERGDFELPHIRGRCETLDNYIWYTYPFAERKDN